MPRDLYLRVRITEKEKKTLEREAKNLGVSVSEVVRDLIKSLHRGVQAAKSK